MERSDFSTWLTVPVRWGDMDAMRHVNHAVYFTYLESARVELFAHLGVPGVIQDDAHGMGLVSVHCNFREQVHYPETLDIGTRVLKIGQRSFELQHAVFRHGTGARVADGGAVMVWVDYRAGKSAPLPAPVRERLEALLPHAA